MENQNLLSVKDLVKFLGISRVTIYRKIESGELPFLRAGKKILFQQEDIDLWLRENAEKGQRKKIRGKEILFGQYQLGLKESLSRKNIYDNR